MPLTPNFSVSQTLGTSRIVTFTDTSSGSDNTVTKARIYFLKADGTYLVPIGNTSGYVEITDISGGGKFATTDVDIMNRDYGLSITVQWLDGSFNILYTKNYKVDLVAYVSNFINGLTQQETALPSIEFTVDYFQQKGHLQTLVDDSNQAIALGADYKKSQVFLDQAYYIINNQTRFF